MRTSIMETGEEWRDALLGPWLASKKTAEKYFDEHAEELMKHVTLDGVYYLKEQDETPEAYKTRVKTSLKEFLGGDEAFQTFCVGFNQGQGGWGAGNQVVKILLSQEKEVEILRQENCWTVNLRKKQDEQAVLIKYEGVVKDLQLKNEREEDLGQYKDEDCQIHGKTIRRQAEKPLLEIQAAYQLGGGGKMSACSPFSVECESQSVMEKLFPIFFKEAVSKAGEDASHRGVGQGKGVGLGMGALGLTLIIVGAVLLGLGITAPAGVALLAVGLILFFGGAAVLGSNSSSASVSKTASVSKNLTDSETQALAGVLNPRSAAAASVSPHMGAVATPAPTPPTSAPDATPLAGSASAASALARSKNVAASSSVSDQPPLSSPLLVPGLGQAHLLGKKIWQN